MKQRIGEIRKDKLQLFTIVAAAGLFICHLYQFIDSGYDYRPLIRTIFAFTYMPLLYFAGRKVIVPFFYIYSIAIAILNGNFLNYTSAWLLSLCILLANKKFHIPMIIGHAATIIAVCTMHVKTPMHLVIYFLNCGILYIGTMLIADQTKHQVQLELTADEEYILQQLRAGKQQKEITDFSVNTITKKLRDARIRNKVETTEELLMLYIQSHMQSQS